MSPQTFVILAHRTSQHFAFFCAFCLSRCVKTRPPRSVAKHRAGPLEFARARKDAVWGLLLLVCSCTGAALSWIHDLRHCCPGSVNIHPLREGADGVCAWLLLPPSSHCCKTDVRYGLVESSVVAFFFLSSRLSVSSSPGQSPTDPVGSHTVFAGVSVTWHAAGEQASGPKKQRAGGLDGRRRADQKRKLIPIPPPSDGDSTVWTSPFCAELLHTPGLSSRYMVPVCTCPP